MKAALKEFESLIEIELIDNFDCLRKNYIHVWNVVTMENT